MNLFTIAQMQQFSGIKAHTIRIWEQRYNALTPIRSEGNTRYYDNEQLRRLLNIVSLLEAETKISVAKACRMSNEELFETVEERMQQSTNDREDYTQFITQLLSAGLQFDEIQFTTLMRQCTDKFGVKTTYQNILSPLLNRVGMMWTSNTMPPAHEHFISNLVRQKIVAATEALPLPTDQKDTWLLFLPEDEFHEIGLLMAHFILREAGKKVFYLGANVPNFTLELAIKNIQPSYLFFFFIHHNVPPNSQAYLDYLTQSFASSKVVFSGNNKLISELTPSAQTLYIPSVEALNTFLINQKSLPKSK